jgi:hypothetical protein
MMVFRNGGKVKREDRIAYGREQLNVEKSYKYIGITSHSSETAFTRPRI